MKEIRAANHLAAMAFTLFAFLSCESEDPSALGESQKALAEAVAQTVRLEQEVSSLRAQLDQANAEPTVVTEQLKIPTLGELEASLGKQSAELMEQARKAHPGAKIEGYQAWDLNIPSFERPFSGKVRVVAREPGGKVHELYWIAMADLEGQWSFQQVERLTPPGGASQENTLASENRHAEQTQRDAEPEQKPVQEPATGVQRPPADTPAYDIPLDRPIMGPGSR